MATLSARVTNPKASKSGVPIYADTSGLNRLARDLRRGAPSAWAACRLSLRAYGEIVADEARSISSGFSTRIPDSIKVRVSNANVKVVAGGDAAPDAAALENKGNEGTFRHPVFGHRDRWVEQEARPFLSPALERHREEIATGIEKAVFDAVKASIGAI